MRWPATSPPERPPDARRREMAVDLAAQLVVDGRQPIAQAVTSAILHHVRHNFGHPSQLVALAMTLYPLVVDEIQHRTRERIALAKRRRRKAVRGSPLPPELPPGRPSRRRKRQDRTAEAIARVLERQTDRGIRGIGRASTVLCLCGQHRDTHLFKEDGSSPCTWSDCGCELFRPASLRRD
jgi:hypothetical protein